MLPSTRLVCVVAAIFAEVQQERSAVELHLVSIKHSVSAHQD